MTKKRILSIVIFIIMLLSLTACGDTGTISKNSRKVLGGVESSVESSSAASMTNPSVEYTADDIKYVSKENEEIAKINGRAYTKTNNGVAAVALLYIKSGYTGPILVGKTPEAVSYTFSYNGKNVVNQYDKVTVDDEEWYYSKSVGFMGGNYLSFNPKLSIYCSKMTSSDEAAKEIIPLLKEEKFAGEKIMNADDLKKLANSSGIYELGADIDLSAEDNWQPIEGFNGTLSGNGYKIINLTINATNEENVGLFGYLQGKIENLTLENIVINYRGNKGNVGIVAGLCSGVIKNVSVSGEIKAQNAGTIGETGVGGIVGCLGRDGRLYNNVNLANVNGMNDVGGIAGYVIINSDNAIENNLNQGEVIGVENVGGVGGYITCYSYSVTSHYTYEISKNNNEGSVNGQTDVGGVFGFVHAKSNNYYGSSYSNYFNISLLKNSATVVGDGDDIGGLIGLAKGEISLSLSENNGDVTGECYVGGFAGKAIDMNIDAGYFKNVCTITGRSAIGAFGGYVGVVSYAINEGNVISLGPYVDNNGTSYANTGGIAGIAYGAIDCKNYSDITVSHSGQNVGGILGECIIANQGNYTKNTNYGNIKGNENVGGITGYLTCQNKGSTSTDTYELEDNRNEGNVTGLLNVGGIAGYTNAIANNYYGSTYRNYFIYTLCENIGEISAKENYVGGICGQSINVSISSLCENTGSITGKNYVGGLYGSAKNTKIQASGFENSAIIKGNAYVGGIAGYAGIIENATTSEYGQIISVEPMVSEGKSFAYVGGIAGYCQGAIYCKNYAEINVIHAGIYVGGIAGYIDMGGIDQVKNNSNYGNITGTGYTGGIAAYVSGGNFGGTTSRLYSMTNNNNYGKIVGTNYAGGIVGYVNAMADTYYGSTYYHYVQITNSNNHGEVIGNIAGGIVGGYTRLKTDTNIMDTNTTDYGDKLGS